MPATEDKQNGAHFSTQSVHAGEIHNKPYGSLTMPIVQTSTFAFEDSTALCDFMQQKIAGVPLTRGEYGRYGNPNQQVVEQKLAALDGGEAAAVFASGMAAVTATLLTLLSQGDHFILTDDCYRRTRQFSLEFLARFGVSCTLVPMGDLAALEEAITPKTRLILTETPTNPYLRVVDLPALAAVAKRHGLLSMVDVTFGTPYNIKPLAHGIDLVIHSATKYLGGHNDLLAGVVIGSSDLVESIRMTNHILGAVAGANTMYLLQRGLKTLGLRMARHNQNGQQVAEFLEAQPVVRQVWYPGLPSHPDYAVARRLMNGFGGVVSFELDTDLEGTAQFIDGLKIPYIGPSLGGVESIVEQPALMSHFSLCEAEREQIGIRGELVRYALGIEDTDDLIRDLEQALVALELVHQGADSPMVS